MPIKFMASEDTIESNEKLEPIPGDKPRRRGRPPGSKTGANVEAQIKDELSMLGGLVGILWGARDPVCAGVFAQQSELIAGDLAKLAAKSKFARRYLEKVADLGEIIPLFMHVYPILQTVHEHHVKPRIAAQQAEREAQQSMMFDGAVA